MYNFDDVMKLRKAVETYHDELADYAQKILTAADACDQAMGSDANAQRHITNLYHSLEGVKQAILLAEDLIKALDDDMALAEETLHND